jgi:hypothetical protein
LEFLLKSSSPLFKPSTSSDFFKPLAIETATAAPAAPIKPPAPPERELFDLSLLDFLFFISSSATLLF